MYLVHLLKVFPVCSCFFFLDFDINHKKSRIKIKNKSNLLIFIIESVDSISRDERDAPLTQYITNAGISRARYTIMHFKHHHRVL